MEQYDIFISCKSEDYEIAEKVYSFLKDNGFSVFLSSKELRRMAQADYMDAISVALDTAYSMIVISTKKEYLTSKWVKFEWSTFLNEILSGRKTGQIMTLADNIKVHEFPIQLRKYESFTLENYEDILPYLENPKKQVEPQKEVTQDVNNDRTNSAEVHIETDIPCRIMRFKEELITAVPDDDNLIKLKKGTHKLKFVSIENEQDNYSQVFTVKDDCEFLQVSLTKIREARLAKQEEERRAKEEKQNTFDAKIGAAEVHIETDIACRIMRFKEELITAVPDDDNLIHLKKGTHKLTFVSIENEQDNYSQVYIVKDECEFLQVSLTKIRDARLAKEEEDRLAKNETIRRILEGLERHAKEKEACKRLAKNETIRRIIEGLERYAKEKEACKRLAEDDAKYQRFYKNGKYGFKKDGIVIIPIKYDFAGYFHDGLAEVKLNGKSGYIDKSGKEVIPIKYDFAGLFHDGLAEVKLNGKSGYIDKSGKEVIPIKYNYASSFRDGLALVRLNGRWGYIDKSGKEIIPIKYEDSFYFSDGLAVVKLNGKSGYIRKNGKEVTPIKYNYAGSFSEGLARVKLDGKWGYIDKNGVEFIPIKYDHAGSFSEGLAAVKCKGIFFLKDKWGYIDKNGNQVIPFKYDYAESFSRSKARVELNGKRGTIDKQGNFTPDE